MNSPWADQDTRDITFKGDEERDGDDQYDEDEDGVVDMDLRAAATVKKGE